VCSSDLEKELNTRDFWKHYFGIKEYQDTIYVWSSGGFLGAIIDITMNTFGVYTGVYLHKLVYK
jgi:hypothetical protein